MSQIEIPSFREKLIDVLSATKYNINLTADQLISFENEEKLHQFTEWFALNITEDNCLTPEEVEEFQKLQENGDVLSGEDLDKAVQSYYEGAGEAESTLYHLSNMNKQEELLHLEEQLALKEKLSSIVRNSVSSLEDDISDLKDDLKHAKQENEYAMNKLNLTVMKYISQLDTMKTSLKMLHDDIASLEQDSEISTDKSTGILPSKDANLTDQLNCSLISTTSTSSLLSTCKYTGFNTRFLCQLPFDKYYKQHERFCRILEDKVHDKIAKLIELSGNTRVNFDLEVQCLLERLLIQKKQLIYNEAKTEGIKAAQKKINEILHKVRCKTFNADEFIMSDLNDSNLDECNSSQNEDTSDEYSICQLWKLKKNEQIKQHQCVELSAVSDLIKTKLNQFIEIMKVKKSADTVLYHLLYTEEGKVERTISLYETACNNVKTKTNEIRERIKIINENIDDYAEFCAQPVQEHSDMSQSLAKMLSSDKLDVKEALYHLVDQYHSKHEDMVVRHEQEIQQLIKDGQKLKASHRNFMEERIKQQGVDNLEKFETILEQLGNINKEIHDAVLHCKSVKNNKNCLDENNEVGEMLQSILENGIKL